MTKHKLTPEKTLLLKLVARGHVYNLRSIAMAFGYDNPYDTEDSEYEVTESLKEDLLTLIISASDDDIEHALLYLRDEAYIDL